MDNVPVERRYHMIFAHNVVHELQPVDLVRLLQLACTQLSKNGALNVLEQLALNKRAPLVFSCCFARSARGATGLFERLDVLVLLLRVVVFHCGPRLSVLGAARTGASGLRLRWAGRQQRRT